MSEEDDANYRRRISDVLNERGFGWVVAQAETQIAEGKPTSRQISEQSSELLREDFTLQGRRPRRASLITSEPYTESERLEILLQGIEAAVVQRSMIEQAILDAAPDVSVIHFEPDAPIGDTGLSYFGVGHTLEPGRKTAAVELEAETQSALRGVRGKDHAGS